MKLNNIIDISLVCITLLSTIMLIVFNIGKYKKEKQMIHLNFLYKEIDALENKILKYELARLEVTVAVGVKVYKAKLEYLDIVIEATKALKEWYMKEIDAIKIREKMPSSKDTAEGVKQENKKRK